MKKIIAIMINVILICLNVFELVHAGFFKDVHPDININEVNLYFFWISLFLSVILLVTMLYFITKQNVSKKRLIANKCIMLLIAVLFCSNIFVGVKYYSIVKDYSLKKVEETDYIASEYFRGISLDELKKNINADTEVLIYIGREDCKDCREFEEKFEKLLEKYYVEMPTYYTTKDRDGDRSKEMYDLLDKYAIESVPCVIMVKDSMLLKLWDNPIEQLDDIENYL
jgi:thiol-disulfide isomerase/thioredoxin